MHYHEPECSANRLFCCLQGQGFSEGSYYQNVTDVSIEVLIRLQLNFGLMAQYKLCCPVKKVHCFVCVCSQVQGHSKGLRFL